MSATPQQGADTATPVSGAEQMREACAKFLRAWDSLPKGDHSVEAISKWLNSAAMVDGVLALRSALPLPVASPDREAIALNALNLVVANYTGRSTGELHMRKAAQDALDALHSAPSTKSEGERLHEFITWSDEHYARARDCAFDILSKDGYGLDRSKFDNAFQHAVGILALHSAPTKTDGGGALS